MLVADTAPLVALLDADDRHHRRCLEVVEERGEDIVVPAPVLVELDYWVQKLLGPDVWLAFAQDVLDGAYRLYQLDEADVARAAELERRYEDLDLGFVDAAVVTACERLGETKVLTLDRRDFSVVRPRHCDALTLLPE